MPDFAFNHCFFKSDGFAAQAFVAHARLFGIDSKPQCLGLRRLFNERPELQGIRKQTVEHPFGAIKQWMNQSAFLMRRLEKGPQHQPCPVPADGMPR